jgi:hypothetical protein
MESVIMLLDAEHIASTLHKGIDATNYDEEKVQFVYAEINSI